MKLGNLKKLSILCFSFMVISSVTNFAHATEEKFPFGVMPKEMLGITMKDGDALHDLHVTKLEAKGKDCTACHIDDDYENFMALGTMSTQDDKVAYLHNTCVDCHKEMGGPQITSCRSCHSSAYTAQ